MIGHLYYYKLHLEGEGEMEIVPEKLFLKNQWIKHNFYWKKKKLWDEIE